ncbi:metal ABC transporter permease [Kineococcus auxinigenes]|uniref:metal ABC transporter permease n=1 Tax=unclassified Kineococcus TaxID=2621656 RepID=UPI003D7E7893
MPELLQLLDYAFLRRALLAAAMVGLAAPLVGAFLVQRGLSLVGDGLGHVALAGVGVGALTGRSPVWAALVAAVGAALLIEIVRHRGRTGGDVALALLFYGGIAAGAVLLSLAPAGGANLESYLFGAITTTSAADVRAFAALTAVVVVAVLVLRPWFFAAGSDEEHARAVRLPVFRLNCALAVLTAVTVVLSMRTVGLLLVSALLVVPVATAQRLCRGFGALLLVASAVGAAVGVGGVAVSAVVGTPSGGTIVLLALAVFALAAALRAGSGRVRRTRVATTA